MEDRSVLLRQLQGSIDAIQAGNPETFPASRKKGGPIKGAAPFSKNTVDSSAVEDMQDPDSAFRRLERLLLRADKSSGMAQTKLKLLGYSDDAAGAAVQRAVDCGLIDDRRYAEAYWRIKSEAGFGAQRIRSELRGKGISDSMITQAWTELSECNLVGTSNDFEVALKYARRHMPRSKNPYASLYAQTLRRGFSSEVAGQVAKTLCAHAVQNQYCGLQE